MAVLSGKMLAGGLGVLLMAEGVSVLKIDYLRDVYQWRGRLGSHSLSEKDLAALATKPVEARSFKECDAGCPEMVVIPAGKFMMGSPESEEGHNQNEGPQHEVTIAKPFAVGKFTVTFAEWDACTAAGACRKAIDSGWGRDKRPVINLSWDDAQQYVGWLSRVSGKPYRLLSEAEWEYAARAGATTSYWWGNEIGEGKANCDGCKSQWDGQQTAPVDTFKPNPFGLYQMHGNVWQWVQDCYEGDYAEAPRDGSANLTIGCDLRVLRGGSWIFAPRNLRAAQRVGVHSDFGSSFFGFRLARTITP
ncbi:MAG: formylglycine-generating enzyme family protein [Rhodomicrobium sp.]